jgi:hypothetical protein
MPTKVRERVIRAYFRDVRKRAELLPELHKRRFTSEAMMIACCYIEAAGKRVSSPGSGNKERFVLAIIEYGESPHLGLIHPTQLLDRLPRDAQAAAGEILRPRFGSLMSTDTARELLADTVDQGWLDQYLWKGTLAAIAYEWIRNQAVHSGRAIPITFDETQHNGQAVQALDFQTLHAALGHVLDGVEAYCLEHPETFD